MSKSDLSDLDKLPLDEPTAVILWHSNNITPKKLYDAKHFGTTKRFLTMTENGLNSTFLTLKNDL
jgi:hypothetical protein